MELRLTEQEALTLYRIILRWDELGSLSSRKPMNRYNRRKKNSRARPPEQRNFVRAVF